MRSHVRSVCASLVAVATCCGSAAAQKPEIVVGAGFVLSGPVAAYGEDGKVGVDLAAEEINAKGGVLGRPLKVVYEDTGADRAKAVATYRKFAADPNCVAAMTISSIEFVALDPVAKDTKLPFVALGSAAPMKSFSPYSFRVQLIIDKAMPTVLTQIKKMKNAKTIAVISDTVNNYNVGEMESVKAAAPQVGLELVGSETFATNDQNFTLQLTRLASLNPDILYVAATTNEAMLIIGQARALGMKSAIMGGAGLNDTRIGTVLGKTAEGIMTFNPFDPSSDREAVKRFVRLYKTKYGQDKTPPGYVALGYDTLNLIIQAVERAGSTDREAINKALGTTKDYEGANGLFSYNGSGDNLVQNPNVYEYRDNGYRRVSP
jgi:branched-chain amino acid transport system substrate-binding protein